MDQDADIRIIDLTPDNIADYGVCGYKDVAKHLELRNKIAWFSAYYPKGLRIKAVMSKTGGYQGMLEYVPGEYAHRPVQAAGYLFIHCVFVGFKSAYKGHGMATQLLQDCVDEARAGHYQGVAVVTRKGPFMAHNDIFLKQGFQVVDSAPPDFDLLALKFGEDASNPQFKHAVLNDTSQYAHGLTVMRSFQCPYTEKNVKAILQSAEEDFHIQARVVDLADAQAAQNAPSPFGTFCLIYEGEVLSHHPISSTRFANIMRQKLK
jgi:GNAT superfamily N-acetyltransferase